MAEPLSLLAEGPGERLDRYLSEHCPGLSRTRARKLIEEGKVAVNGAPARPSLKLAEGDRVTIEIPPPSAPPVPQAIPLQVLYEDEDVLVLDKPAGIAVHPAPGHQEGTLVNAILARYPHLAETDDSLRPGIVHRLDKDTSGLMLVAKNADSRKNLQNQFKKREVKKIYLVLVRGKLVPEEGVIEGDIGRSPRDRKRMAVVAGGKEARTRYRVVEYLDGYTFLEVSPETGRTHQIRVHLGAIGFPVMGDAVYGVKSPHLSRQFLHAGKIGFRLPSTGEYWEFTAALPEDLQQALEQIRTNDC